MIVVFQRRVPNVIAAMIGAIVLTSIVAAVDARSGGDLYRRLALVPMHVWHGQVWRLVTWTLVETHPLRLLWTCLLIYAFGSDLLDAWGRARFARFVGGVVMVAAAGTSLAGLLLPMAWWVPHLAGYALDGALLIAWARTFPDRRVSLYGLIVLGSDTLVYATIGVTALFAIFFGVTWVLPEVFAEAFALRYFSRSSWYGGRGWSGRTSS